ncbi:uncharacterized protein LAESUDRAFT_749884 [Laetiporus sulphureus 93-53]|uniref:Uncharacterized protein n=1 Tax=Laetiporus sulphureus 93-53 TaxID=1314785 RepID=A0A165EBI2_9APHY|nr:uncharacterized protein LAESUDRAFT_749884 [Laetiporus sulphureus 93-53]KZT06666.1 hypothetical protein LAESUDRAFT_749884 [Laetiporus sulphureus 93-53]
MTGPNLHLDDTLGCLLVGVLLSAVLYGCVCSQGIFYLWNYNKDKIPIKCFSIWYYFVQNRGDVIELMSLVPFFIVNIWRRKSSLIWYGSGHKLWHSHERHVGSNPIDNGCGYSLSCIIPWNMHYIVELETEVKVFVYTQRAKPLASLFIQVITFVCMSSTLAMDTLISLFVLVTYLKGVQDNRLVVMVLYMPLGDVYINTSLAILNARNHVTASSYALSEIGCSIEMSTEEDQGAAFVFRRGSEQFPEDPRTNIR